jgi:beta-N-acetylhexosaminidase
MFIIYRLSRISQRVLIIFSLLIILCSIPGLQVRANSSLLTPEIQASSLLDRLTPEERVGQLFLITFQGTDVGVDTPIYELITKYNIGGVLLLARNDNIVDLDMTNTEYLRQIQDINQQIQQNEWNYSRQSQVDFNTGQSYFPSYIPLFIATSQEGDGYPYDQILHGMTPLPNEMTLGATWNPEMAAKVGEILGEEISALGFNMLLGPSLDVLESPQIEASDNLGTRTFGGDPYWVSEMGRAYIRGVHVGSAGHVSVVANHFPGHGSSDRLPEVEVATVRKSLDELKSFDLAPFFAVTGNAQSSDEITDALLISHIRYQGLQGNIRATTRPVSLDPQALSLLIGLPELDAWRKEGGLMISDDLGSLAVRRFYDLTSQTFDARRVALNAFLAGNDLLYIADFSSADIPDSITAATRTLDFFAQKYREDAAFAQRVDASVLRILTLKFHLFQNFTLSNVLSTLGNLEGLGNSSQITFEVARNAATLISPTQAEIDETVPDPPNQSDRIVFISDNREAKQCTQCESSPMLPINAIQDAVLRLYGPQAGGQVVPYNLSSYSLADLQQMLVTEPDTLAVERDLKRANWIVFGMLSDRNDISSYQTLRQFLSERPDLFQQKRLVVFAFCAPYFLDATNISKLTAYYGLYSKTPQFVDVAAYLLFRELRPSGASPVSIRGIGYNLNEALFPDPEKVISLELDLPYIEVQSDATITPTPTPPPEFHIGDVIPLRTGVILDHNGNPVPDGTPVSFVFSMGAETNSVRQVATTQQGVARTTYAVVSSGVLDIHAESENARSGNLKLDIPSPSGESVTITPTQAPTQTFEPSSTPTVLETVENTPIPLSTTPSQPDFGDWLMALLISGGLAWAVYRMSSLIGQIRWGVRAGFLTLIGGLLAYSYLALKLPGSEGMLNESVSRSVFLSTLAGTILGLLVAFFWQRLSDTKSRGASTGNSH